MKLSKKLISILLSVLMIVCAFPMASISASATPEGTGVSSLPTSAGTYYLTQDVTISSSWNITSAITLDLNGHGIKRTGSGSVIVINNSNANLTINDSNPTGTTHYFNVSNNRATNVNDTSGTYSFTGGYITGGNYSTGGGFRIDNGKCTINGGTILGNEGSTHAGAFWVRGCNNFTMNGGTIMYNTTAYQGAAIDIDSSTAHFNGGKIINNYSRGGGWAHAGGIHICTNATLYFSGDIVVENNRQSNNGNECIANVTMNPGKGFYIDTNHMSPGASVGVYTTTVPTDSDDTEFVKGGANVADAAYFHSDRCETAGVIYCGGSDVHKNAVGANVSPIHHTSHTEGTLWLSTAAAGYALSYNANGGTSGTVPAGNMFITAGTEVTVSGNTGNVEKTGYTFNGWNTKNDGTGTAYTADDTFGIYNDTILYAQWTEVPTGPNNGVNITVADTISENFYIDGDYYGADAYVTVNYNHNSNLSQTANFNTDDPQKLSEMDKISGGDYAGNSIISVIQAPAQSTEPITINVYASQADAEAGTNPVDTIEYSVYTYCREIIEGEYEDDVKDLAKATLDYAAAAQLYFNYNTDNMATTDNSGNAFYGDVADVDFDGVAGVSSLATGIQSFSVVVKSDLEINLLSRTPINVTSASIDTTDTSRFAAQSTTNGDWYVVHISGIEPANMDNTFTVVTDKGDIEMSANAIMKLMANSDDEKLVTLAKAMYLYGAAANAYFD